MPQHRWSPWGALAERPDIWMARLPLVEGRGWWVPAERVILLEVALDRCALRCVLAHELAHAVLDHGDAMAFGDGAWLAARHEAQADRWAAERLLPIGSLAEVLSEGRDLEAAAQLLDVESAVLRRRLAMLTAAEQRALCEATAHLAA